MSGQQQKIDALETFKRQAEQALLLAKTDAERAHWKERIDTYSKVIDDYHHPRPSK